MVTQNDIAKKLQVSQALVSKVLNNKILPGSARPEVVEQIREAAKEMGYVKNRSSLELLSGRHHVIGVFIRNLGGTGLFEPFITGVSEEADRHHQKLWLRVYNERTDMTEMLSKTNRGMIDGLIFGSWFQKELIRPLIDLQKNGLRIIHATDDWVCPKLSSVPRDKIESATIATEHLIEQGCKRIGYIGHFFWRHNGYKQVLNKHGMRPNPKLQCKVSEFQYQKVRQATEELLKTGVSFDGLFIESDSFATGVMQVLLENGIRIPEDVKLVSVDNLTSCEEMPVPLTSVDKREHYRGVVAVRMLMDLINNRKPKPEKIEPFLVKRASSG